MYVSQHTSATADQRKIMDVIEPKDIKPMDKVLPTILKAVAEWKDKNTEEVISKRVKETLDKSSETIMLKLLGFKESYGNWELDHCNGRSGNSAAGDFLRKVQQSTIEDWLTNTVMPVMTPALQKKLMKQFQDEYAESFYSLVRKSALAQATKDADAVISKLAETDDLARYIKAIQLLNPT